MIKLAFEIPITYLGWFSRAAHYDFALTHMVEKSSIYKDFYRKQNHKGRYIMLDNSAFELGVALDPSRVIDASKEINSNCIIATDVISDGKATISSIDQFIIDAEKLGYKKEIAAVVQGNTLEDWLACYKYIKNNPKIDVICINFNIIFDVPNSPIKETKTHTLMHKRITLINYLVTNNLIDVYRKYHLLGATDCIEYKYLKRYDFIKTADTSSPIVHGINNIQYTYDGLPCDKIKEKIDFDIKLKLPQRQCIERNINIIKKFI